MIHTVVTQQETNVYDGGSLATGKPDGIERFEESEQFSCMRAQYW